MPKGRFLIIFCVTTICTFGFLTLIRALSAPPEPIRLRGGVLQEPITQNNEETLVPSQYILNTGINPEQIPPITKPVFSSVLAADTYLNDTTTGVVAEIDGIARFYPTQILNYHYVVRDTSAAGAFSLTYCPLCQSAVLYEAPNQLYATSYVYNNNVILGDELGNQWNQITGIAISGPSMGQVLPRREGVRTLTWDQFKDRYPSGQVLSEGTGFNREYGVHPFGAYPVNDRVYYPLTTAPQEEMLKVTVAGIPGENIAIPVQKTKSSLTSFGSGERAVIAVYDKNGIFQLFSPYLDGQTLNFTFNKGSETMTDAETGSEWSLSGVALTGTMAGKKLREISYTQAFAMCWIGMNPDVVILSE